MHFSNAFITEDLTPLRSKLLRYVKKVCDNDFVLSHSYNGKIRMKKSAQKTGLPLDKNGNDQGTGKWLTITSVGDLFKINADVDFEKLNYLPLKYNSVTMGSSVIEVESDASTD